jgi:hypothetical protein
MPNADELNATMAAIKENPQLWNQRDYCTETECGTVLCFYGWTLARHGYDAARMYAEEIHKVIMRILDLNLSEDTALAYYYTDSIEDLEPRVKEIIAGEWAKPRDDEDLW